MADLNEPLKESEIAKNADVIEVTIGNFGKWQGRIAFLMSLLKLPIAWIQLGIVFLAPPTEFWCKRPEDKKLMPIEAWKKLIALPQNYTDHHRHMGLQSGSCLMRNYDLNPNIKNVAIPCRWGYEYNSTIFKSTIISEWNLVCGRESFVEISQITLMFGVLIGNLFCGILADKYGRKKILMYCLVLQSVLGILSAWSPWYECFVFLRFIMAVANGGTMIISFVMCMEVVGGTWRIVVSVLYHIPFGIGNTVMASLAYFIRHWRHMELALSTLSAVFVFYYWFLPESPRWLLTMNRKEETIKILEKAARMNNRDPSVVKPFIQAYKVQKQERPKMFALFQTTQIRKRTLLLSLNWFLGGIAFYAFSQYLGVLGSNIFFTVAVGGLISIPGICITVFIIKKCGRKRPLIAANILTGMCCIIILLIPRGTYSHDWPRIIIAALGVVGLSISLPTLYLFTGELFPTVLRNAGVGSSVMCSRIGSMLSPLLIALGDKYDFLPLTILASIVFSQALLIFPLPETKNEILPDNIKDIELIPIDVNRNITAEGAEEEVLHE